MTCPPCNGDCRQGRDCPERIRVDFETMYRAAMETFARCENRRLQRITGSKGIWPSQQEVRSRGQAGGRPKRKVFADLTQSTIKAAEAAALKKAAGNPTREECYSAALSRDHSLGLKSQEEQNDAMLKAEWWFLAWRHRILALIDDQQSSALDEYVKAKVGEALEWAADQVKYTERSVSRLDIAAAIRAMKE